MDKRLIVALDLQVIFKGQEEEEVDHYTVALFVSRSSLINSHSTLVVMLLPGETIKESLLFYLLKSHCGY